ncbi:Uncharacterised protein [Candidatus Gugararchaeum adminiculabundum]|nr:Uncharacterised protein [Candidatus Gugararchaeum adminiculabundum]
MIEILALQGIQKFTTLLDALPLPGQFLPTSNAPDLACTLAKPVATAWDSVSQGIPCMCHSSWVSNSWQVNWFAWQGIGLLAIMIGAFLIAVVYMLSEILGGMNLLAWHRMEVTPPPSGNAGMKAWAKNEMFQVFTTAIIFLSIVGLVNFACAVNTTSIFFSGYKYTALDTNNNIVQVPPYQNMFDEAIRYLDSLSFYSGFAFLYSFFSNLGISFVQGFIWTSRPGGLGVMAQPLAGLSPLMSSSGMVMSTTMIAFLTAAVQVQVLRFVQATMLSVFLPIGLLCRCIEPLRGFGGMLIGLALVMFILYPALLVMNEAVVAPSLASYQWSANFYFEKTIPAEPDPNDPTKEIPTTMYGVGGFANKFAASDPNDPNSGASFFSSPTAYSASALPKTMFDKLVSPFSYLYSAIIRLVAVIFVGVFALTALNFVILTAAVRELTKLLGEEADITNLTRMI